MYSIKEYHTLTLLSFHEYIIEWIFCIKFFLFNKVSVVNYVCTLVLKLLVSEWIWWNLWSGCVFSFIICQKCLSCASIYGVIVLINKFLLIFFSVNGIVLICSFYWHFFSFWKMLLCEQYPCIPGYITIQIKLLPPLFHK